MTVHVELRGVTKVFDAVVAVDDVSLQVPEGRRVVLLGPSGCGKTTTLNLIAGFLRPDAGTIIIGGKPVERVPPHRRNTGMVFQNYALFPHMTVFDNVAFGLRMHRVPGGEVPDRVSKVLALVRLEGYERRYPRQLSGGQQQRVALARALVIEPSVLLLDEPLSNLDAKLRAEMRIELVQILARTGATSVFVTHDQEEALAIADTIVVMNRGRIEQIGSPREIYASPATPFVANFIGESNSFRGVVDSVAGGLLRVRCADGIVLWAHDGGGWSPGEEALVLIRPERVGLSRERTGSGDSIRARIVQSVFLGSIVRYLAESPAGALAATVANVRNSDVFAPGDEVFAEWEAEDCVALHFGPGDGDRSPLRLKPRAMETKTAGADCWSP